MIIADGFESRYQIIYPEDSSPAELKAARELKRYLFGITGAEIPYFRDTRSETPYELVLGYTARGGFTESEKAELGDEGFIIRSQGDKLFILGRKRGVLYGVYEFLESYCGVRFYTCDFELVPEKSVLEICKIDCDKQIPVFSYRNSCWHPQNTPEISVKRKMNGGHCKQGTFSEELGGSEEYYGGFCHTIAALGETGDIWSQPCLTDEKLFKTVVKNVRGILKEYPQAKIISITQNDGTNGQCKCEKCRAINDANESEAGTNIWFVNRVAEELESEYPDVLFDTFAYTYTRIPPKIERPRKNVVVRLCTIETCFRHPIEDCPVNPGIHLGADGAMRDYARRWSEISQNLAVWNYNTNFTNTNAIFPNFDVLRKNARFFAENKVVSVFEQGCIGSYNGEFDALKGYLNAKLLWDPYMSEEKYRSLIREFCFDYYGPGAQGILDFIDLIQDASAPSHMGVYFDDPTTIIYCRDGKDRTEGRHLLIKRANEMFDSAEKAAGNGMYISHIRQSRIQLLDYIDYSLSQDIEEAESEEQKDLLEKERLKNNAKRFEFMRRYDVFMNREFANLEPISEPDYTQHGCKW